MSTVKSKNLQIGTDGTASNNFTIYQPGTPDGTLRVGNGNAGAATDVVTVNSSGDVGIGTSNPSTKFNVVGSDGVVARFKGSTGPSLKIESYSSNNEVVSEGGTLLAGSTNGNIQLYTGTGTATERMRIDQNGHISQPYQPIFSVRDLTYTGSSNVDGVGGSVASNVGSFYNSTNGRFTAPINGNYLFYGNVQYYDSGSTTYIELKFLVNGSQFGTGFPSGGSGIYNNHLNVSGTVIISLNANDYVNIRASYGSRNIQNYFGGFLIG